MVLGLGSAGAFDSTWVGFPSVAKVGSTYHMWYIGRSGGPGTSALGHATSTNGTVWTRDPASPVFTAATSPWEQGGLEAGNVTYDGVLFHLWYSASAGPARPAPRSGRPSPAMAPTG